MLSSHLKSPTYGAPNQVELPNIEPHIRNLEALLALDSMMVLQSIILSVSAMKMDRIFGPLEKTELAVLLITFLAYQTEEVDDFLPCFFFYLFNICWCSLR